MEAAVGGLAEGRMSTGETAVMPGTFRPLLLPPGRGWPKARTTSGSWPAANLADLAGRVEFGAFLHRIAP
jgi:hypothetical protein